jgi:hypothetical protein
MRAKGRKLGKLRIAYIKVAKLIYAQRSLRNTYPPSGLVAFSEEEGAPGRLTCKDRRSAHAAAAR